MDYTTTIKAGTAAVAAVLSYVLGDSDIWLAALVSVIVLDYVTGLCKAYILGQLSSRSGIKGILKKVMYFAVVAVAVITDRLSGAEGAVRAAVMGFLICNEGISILENCAAADLPVPGSLIKLLSKIKNNE